MHNLITDVPGVRVGHAQDPRLASGAPAIVFDEAGVAAVDMRGGGPGTRGHGLVGAAALGARIDAVALSGAWACGLDAASGIQAWLREQGRGFAVGAARIPIVPGAILFDLHVGGDKGWGRYPPYRELRYAAGATAASTRARGSAGAGLGARTVNLKGGTGSASAMCDGFTVGALAAVNAVGSVVVGDGPWFWAAPFEQGSEFGGRGFPSPMPPGALDPRTKGTIRASTTLGGGGTDAALTRPQAARLAIMAQDGLARAIFPVHTPLDGDIVFVAATGARSLADPVRDLMRIGTFAVQVVARAIARGVYEATALPGPLTGAPPGQRPLPAWQDVFRP